MPTAFLFDLDGVIIDSEPQYTSFWTAVGHRDFPEDPQFAHKIKGSTLTQILSRYYPEGSEARERVVEDLNRFEEQMSYSLISGALDFIGALRAEGWRTAVVTSSNHQKMENLQRHHPDLYGHFDRVFTAEDAPRSKPFPDCYENAARALGFQPQDCYVVEDSINGVKAGQASGAHTIGITTSHPAEILRPYCESIVDNYNDLKERIFTKA